MVPPRPFISAIVVSPPMRTGPIDIATFGVTGTSGWWIGGIVGGAVGAVAFGLLTLLVDPAIVEVAIPEIYGLEPRGTVGWAIHVTHGIVLGLVFGFIVTRSPVLEMLVADLETHALARSGVAGRLVGMGFVFGLAVWAVLPVIVLPVWIEIAGVGGDGQFPRAAVASLFGHLVFGTTLGIVFGLTVDLTDRGGP